jgi:hypothetical protein
MLFKIFESKSMLETSQEDKPMWCWTGIVNDNVHIPPEFGGHKWGYVEAEIDDMTNTFQGE